MVNKPLIRLIRPYFLGGGSFGGVARIPLIFSQSKGPIIGFMTLIHQGAMDRSSTSSERISVDFFLALLVVDFFLPGFSGNLAS